MELTLTHIGITTGIAIIGAIFGVAIGRLARNRLLTLVYLAMGVLLAVTAFDVLPDAKEELSWRVFLLAVASGFALFTLVSKYVYPICPACSIGDTMGAEGSPVRVVAWILIAAFSLHCVIDGMALVMADRVRHATDYAVFAGVGIHKFPEGLALTLLLVGSGYARRNALLLACGAELFTVLGGIGSLFLLKSVSLHWPAIFLAHVGGGFLYLILATIRPAAGHPVRHYRVHLIQSAVAFAAAGALLWWARGLG